MSELNADPLSSPSIEVAVHAITVTTIDRSGVTRELLVTLAGIGCSQLMKPLQPLLL